MVEPFVPDDFVIPRRIEQANYVLRPLTTEDVENDYEAVMSSRENLCHIFCENDPGWPAEGMTLQDNYRDLERHQQDFEQRKGFTYTVETQDGRLCLGCVYIYPCRRGNYDASVHYRVRDSVKQHGLESELGVFIRQWLIDAWPFHRPVFPGRDLPWREWEDLKKTLSQ